MITPREGTVIAGRYTLLRSLARGGMGSLWVARHRELDVDVAVKFMAPALIASADARARFEREARSAARLGSQHVVQVLDYGVEDETPYMVMELLRGESLWERLAREGRLPVLETARLVVHVCKALRTAHEAGLVHRDLKPGNVFLASKDEEEVAIVLDFGIAKTTTLGEAQASTESGMLLGSVHYMSPEQVRDSRKVDHRSDLWSLGVILYRVLAGCLPFPGGEIGDVLVRVCTDPIPPPSSIVPDLPAEADGFFARALARDPDERFQSARELAEAFGAMARHAPPPSSEAIDTDREPGPSFGMTHRIPQEAVLAASPYALAPAEPVSSPAYPLETPRPVATATPPATYPGSTAAAAARPAGSPSGPYPGPPSGARSGPSSGPYSGPSSGPYSGPYPGPPLAPYPAPPAAPHPGPAAAAAFPPGPPSAPHPGSARAIPVSALAPETTLASVRMPDTAPQPPPAPRRWPLLAAAAGLAAIAAIAGVSLRGRAPAAPAAASAQAAAPVTRDTHPPETPRPPGPAPSSSEAPAPQPSAESAPSPSATAPVAAAPSVSARVPGARDRGLDRRRPSLDPGARPASRPPGKPVSGPLETSL